MKKLIKSLIVIVLFSSYIYAEPGLVLPLDAYEGQVDEIVIIFDGVEEVIPYTEVTATDGGTYILLKRLGSIAEGDHNGTFYARNIWGQSDTTPFSFTKKLPIQNGSYLLKDIE